MLVAIVAELDEAQERGRVEPRNGAEVEQHITDGLFGLRVDDAPGGVGVVTSGDAGSIPTASSGVSVV